MNAHQNTFGTIMIRYFLISIFLIFKGIFNHATRCDTFFFFLVTLYQASHNPVLHNMVTDWLFFSLTQTQMSFFLLFAHKHTAGRLQHVRTHHRKKKCSPGLTSLPWQLKRPCPKSSFEHDQKNVKANLYQFTSIYTTMATVSSNLIGQKAGLIFYNSSTDHAFHTTVKTNTRTNWLKWSCWHGDGFVEVMLV